MVVRNPGMPRGMEGRKRESWREKGNKIRERTGIQRLSQDRGLNDRWGLGKDPSGWEEERRRGRGSIPHKQLWTSGSSLLMRMGIRKRTRTLGRGGQLKKA